MRYRSRSPIQPEAVRLSLLNLADRQSHIGRMSIQELRLLDQLRLQALLLGRTGHLDPDRIRTALYRVEGDVAVHALTTLVENRSGLFLEARPPPTGLRSRDRRTALDA